MSHASHFGGGANRLLHPTAVDTQRQQRVGRIDFLGGCRAQMHRQLYSASAESALELSPKLLLDGGAKRLPDLDFEKPRVDGAGFDI